MKICVTAALNNLDARVDPRFGRCPYFIIVDSETMQFEAVPNTSIGTMSGAGIHAAQTVVKNGAEVIITGNIGPKAFKVLLATGIKVVLSSSGNVREAIAKFESGELKELSVPTVQGHFGIGPSPKHRGRQRARTFRQSEE